MITLTISGKTYRLACDPDASSVPDEEGWPEPVMTRQGRGRSYTYTVTPAQRVRILSWIADSADVLDGCGDAGASADQRALRRDVDRNRWCECGCSTLSPCSCGERCELPHGA